MAMLYLIFALFISAILAAFLIPNKMVSKHKKDHRD